jgi:hypothetical protein
LSRFRAALLDSRDTRIVRFNSHADGNQRESRSAKA